MAASYQTGSATSPNDLLSKLATWLVAQGWTSNMNSADGTGTRVHLQKGSIYINFRSFISELISDENVNNTARSGIALYGSTGYNAGLNWKRQPGYPTGTGSYASICLAPGMILPSGSIVAYHFFDDGVDNIVVVVETVAGYFRYIGFGSSIDKAGSITGSTAYVFGMDGAIGLNNTADYYNGSLPTAHNGDVSAQNGGAVFLIKADVDTFTGKWCSYSYQSDSASNDRKSSGLQLLTNFYTTFEGDGVGDCVVGGTNYYKLDAIVSLFKMKDSLLNLLNNRHVLIPCYIFASRYNSIGGMSLLGTLPNIYQAGKTGVAAKIIQYGSENYMWFPPGWCVRKFA